MAGPFEAYMGGRRRSCTRQAIANTTPANTANASAVTTSKTYDATAVDLFRAEKIATVPDRSHHECRFCGSVLTLVRTIMESESGIVIHMFECEPCGDRTWTD